jgi:hypothetical protein
LEHPWGSSGELDDPDVALDYERHRAAEAEGEVAALRRRVAELEAEVADLRAIVGDGDGQPGQREQLFVPQPTALGHDVIRPSERYL